MPRYRFKARNTRNKLVRGVVYADSPQNAENQLRSRKYEIVSLKEARGLLLAVDYWLAQVQRPSLFELGMTTRQLATMLSSGVSIVRALQVLNQQPLSARMMAAWHDVALEVQQGSYLSRAVGRHPDLFDTLYVGMVKAGEASGSLSHNLTYLADHLEKEVNLRGKIRSAMTYPAVVFLICVLVSVVIVQHILPQFINSLFRNSGVQLPWITRSLIWLTDFFNSPLTLGTGVAFLGIGLYLGRAYLGTAEGRYRLQKVMLALPVLRTVAGKALASRFCRVMGTLIASGVPIVHCLDLSGAALGNYVLGQHLEEAKNDLLDGGKLSSSLRAVPFFPPMLAGFVELGETTGTLPRLLARLAAIYEEELEIALETFTTLLEPLMIAVMGVVVGYVLLAVFIPLYKIMGNF